MDWLTFTNELLKAYAWPIVTIAMFLMLRKPIIGLFRYIARIKYKDLEIELQRDLDKVKEEIPAGDLDEVKQIRTQSEEAIHSLAKTDPVQAVLAAWKQTEEIIYAKLKELYPEDSPQAHKLELKRSYAALGLTGALTPKSEETLQRLYFFKDGIERHRSAEVTTNIAMQYYDLCKYMQHKVISLTELPQVKLTALTYLILELNAMIDTGKYQHISIEDIEREIEKGTVLQYVAEQGGDDIDLSLITKANTYPNFREFYIEYLQSIYNAYSGNERRKWGIEKSGLCLLLAWTNEIIQQGGGWHPSR